MANTKEKAFCLKAMTYRRELSRGGGRAGKVLVLVFHEKEFRGGFWSEREVHFGRKNRHCNTIQGRRLFWFRKYKGKGGEAKSSRAIALSRR